MTATEPAAARVDDHQQDRELYESAPCGYVTTTSEGRILRANTTLARWLGLGVEELVGSDFADLLGQGARLMWLTHHLGRLEEVGHLDAVALDLTRKDGTALPALVSGVLPELSEPGRREMWFTVVDASERRAYERELVAARRAASSAERRMRSLQRVTEACSAALSEIELGVAVEAVTVSLGVTRSRLWIATGDEGWTVVPEDPEALSPPEPVAAAWRSTQPVLPVEDGWEGDTTAAVPFGHAGQLSGVLEVVVPPTWRGRAADLAVLTTMAPVIGQALARVRMQRRLEELALYDQLTGLPNRRLLLERLDAAIADAVPGQPLGLLFVDLDGFKAVNDVHGHLAGDQLLRALSSRFSRVAQGADVVARLGGDEFVLVRLGADEEAIGRLADRVRASASRPVDLPEARVQVSASVGEVVVRAPFTHAGAEALLATADAAMYDEKRRSQGRSPA